MQHLLLLHGAIGAKDQLEALAESCSQAYIVHTLNFSGHGGEQMPADVFSIPLFAGDVLEYLDKHNIPSVNIFGYSMGGYVAMFLAKHFPGRVQKLITLATKFYWDEKIAEKESRMLNADTIFKKLPAFAQQLAQRHAPNDWKLVLEKTNQMLVNLGWHNCLQLKDYAAITQPCLLLLGERDNMVTREETEAVHEVLPNGTFNILPAAPHPIERLDVAMLSHIIAKFIG